MIVKRGGLGIVTDGVPGLLSGSSLKRGLLCWYPGQDTGDDASPNGYDLTPQVSPTYDATGVVGKCFQPGRDAGGRHWTLDSPLSVALAPGKTSFSLACHVETNVVHAGYIGFYSHGAVTGDARFDLRLRPDINLVWVALADMDSTNTLQVNFAGMPASGSFVSIVAVIDRKEQTMRMFFDDVESTTGPVDISSIGNIIPTGDVLFGKSKDGHTSHLKMDELAIWGRALTYAEVVEYGTGITYSDL